MVGVSNCIFSLPVKERRPVWKRNLVSILYTLALAVMLITAAAAMISGPALLTWAAHYVGLDAVSPCGRGCAGRLRGRYRNVRGLRSNIVSHAPNSAATKKMWIDQPEIDAWLIWNI